MKHTILSLLLLLLPVVTHAQLPPPDHPITFGYYYADKPQYGDYRSSTNCYTDSYYLLVKWGAQANPNDPLSVWFPKMQQQIADAVAAGKNVHLNLDFEDPDFISVSPDLTVTLTPLFGQVLDALAPYWNSVVRIELSDEPTWDSNKADAIARAVKQELDRRAMTRKPMGIVLGRGGLFKADDPGLFSNPLNSTELSWIGVEAYLCAPGIQCQPDTTNGDADSTTNISLLNQFLTKAKNRVEGSGKDVVLVMQGYTLSYTWDPWLSNVTDMQAATYLQAYNDSRVVGINIFAYGRPDGTVAHPEFQSAHKQIATALYGSLPPGCDSVAPIPAPSNLQAGAQGFRVNLTWSDNSSNESEFRVQRMDNNSGVWNTIASVPANTTSFTDNTAALSSGGSATYSYRVRARNGSAASDFSNVATVSLYGDLPGVPVLVAPSLCITTLRPTFSWNPTPRANDYYIAVTTAGVDNFFVNQPGVRGTMYNLTSDLLVGVQYRWKVKACNNLGCGGWAPSVFFKTFCSGVQATITAPLGCIATQTPTFVWTPVPGAVDYWLLVANSPDFSAPTTTWYVNASTTATSYYPGVVFSPNTTYYAKVKTHVAPGSTAGGWSATISFTPLCPDSSPR